jgi:prepilin-type N-terminal cleavage/methylation domain-containing protein
MKEHKNIKKYTFKKGFSIIELVIAVAIIVIMSSVIIISLTDSKDQQSLKTAAREVAAAIRDTQNNALAGKNAGGTCKKYCFNTAAGSSNYTTGGNTCNGGGCPVSNLSLKNGVTFAAASSMSFAIPRGDPGDFSSGTSLSVQLTKGGSSYYVCVSAVGYVYEQESAC